MRSLRASQGPYSSSPSTSTPLDRNGFESPLLQEGELKKYFDFLHCDFFFFFFSTHTHIMLLLFSWADAATNMTHISAGFDQEASAVIMARMGVAK